MAMGDWYYSGQSAEQKLKDIAEKQAADKAARQSAYETQMFRWWMKATPQGEDGRYLTFVDEEGMSPYGYEMPFVFFEHQLQLNGHWRNWFSCIEPLANIDKGVAKVCPICLAGFKASWSSAYTVVDHSEWTESKTGKVHVDELKLFVCKSSVNSILRKAARKKGGLRGWRVEVMRTTSDDPNTGNVFDFEKRVELPPDIVAPNYAEMFARKSEDELTKVLTGGVTEKVAADDDDIRF